MPSFDQYEVKLVFNDTIVGGIPIVPEEERQKIYRGWLHGQGLEPEDAAEITDKLVNDPDMPSPPKVEEEEESKLSGYPSGFKRDAVSIYVEARQIKALIKEAAQRLGLIKRVRGMRQVLQHDVHVRQDGSQKLRFRGGDGQIVNLASGLEQRPISVITPQGPRTAIKTYEYLKDASLAFEIRVLRGGAGDGLLGPEELLEIFSLGELLGLGADRSQGEGTFRLVSLVSLSGKAG